jgi:hypothetical protein
MRNIYLIMIFLCILISPGLTENNISWQGEPPRIEDIHDFSPVAYLRSIGEESADAIRLNTLGLKAYKQNNLLKAAKLWGCSVLKKDNYHWAHYNYACALALFAESFCINPAEYEHDYLYTGGDDLMLLYWYMEKIFYHLKKSITLSPLLFNRMQEDGDLDIIRDMHQYKFMLLFPENAPGKLLNTIKLWYGSDTGIYPDGGYAAINGNEITITIVNISFDDYEKTEISSFDKTGTFTINGNKIKVFIDSPEEEVLEGEITAELDEFGFVVTIYFYIDSRYYSNYDPNIGGT